jgi:transcriptional regulator with XRE-family HTH domain
MKANGPAIDAVAYARRLNNRQLAHRAGVTPSFLRRLRKGERTASESTFQRIAEALEAPIDAIMLPHEPVKAARK